MDFLKHLPVELLYGCIAIFGGAARYLNSYTTGVPFSLRMFCASMFVSGFSGYMFAIMGISMQFPSPMLFIMAGTGGFFGDQTMKLVFEYIGKKKT